jgi:hypothetical protein
MAFRPVSPTRPLTRTATLRALLLVGAAGALVACGDDPKPSSSTEVDDPDASGSEADASSTRPDAGQSTPGEDGSTGGGGGDDGGVTEPGDGGCQGSSCSDVDPLAPWALNCGNLPTGTRCSGGPREVLLAMEDTGWIVMLDPADGHFLGYFKRPSADYTLRNHYEYKQATQGPDQCIWTVSEDDTLQVERWDTNGSFIDKPLEEKVIDVTGSAPEPAIYEPGSIAFTSDRVYVASTYGYPEARLTRWTLDGKFDGVVLDDGTEAAYFAIMGDGALLVSDANTAELTRFPAGGGQPEKVSSVDLYSPKQFSYLGDNKVLLADSSLGEPLNVFDLSTGVAETIYPYPTVSANIYGVAPLKNGKWLVAGGEFALSSVDPASDNPKGQYSLLFDDDAIDSLNFKFVGRACLSEEFVASRASKPPVTSCTVPSGSAILEENFDTGSFTGSGASQAFKNFRAIGTSGVTLSLETPSGGTSPALKIEGGTDALNNGVRVTFPSAVKPSYVGYRVRALYDEDFDIARENSLGHFSLTNSAVTAAEGNYARAILSYLFNDYVRAGNSNAAPDDQRRGAWARIELRDINWDTRSFDFYLDCVRIAENVAIPAGYGDDVDTLDLFNYVGATTPNAVVWFDDISIK